MRPVVFLHAGLAVGLVLILGSSPLLAQQSTGKLELHARFRTPIPQQQGRFLIGEKTVGKKLLDENTLWFGVDFLSKECHSSQHGTSTIVVSHR